MKLSVEGLELRRWVEFLDGLSLNQKRKVWYNFDSSLSSQTRDWLNSDYIFALSTMQNSEEELPSLWLLDQSIKFKKPARNILDYLNVVIPESLAIEATRIDIFSVANLDKNYNREQKIEAYRASQTQEVKTVKKGRKIMDNNITAFLSTGAVTCKVAYAGSLDEAGVAKQYTFITTEKLEVGDQVVVPSGPTVGRFSVAIITEMHDTLQIRPDEDMKYQWVAQKVDMTKHIANLQRLRALETQLDEAYQRNIQKSFAQTVLSALDDETRASVMLLTKAPD